MSLEKEKKKFFNECMRCKNAVKKRMIGSKEWLVSCSRNTFVNESSIVMPSDENKESCPFYTERIVMSLQED